jgi:hypothetical protein
MTETTANTAQRDRSPSYPIVPLEIALTRLAEFDAHFKRSTARPEKVGDAWKIKTKTYADRMAAALKYFGLLEYQGVGQARQVVVSEEGRKYLRTQEEETKREIAKAAALRPKQIAKFWSEWGADRPADAACLDELVLKNGFSEVGARQFLKVYDATITYTALSDSDKISKSTRLASAHEDEDEVPDPKGGEDAPPVVPKGKVKIMDGERELTTGLLSKDANFRLLVSGQVGVKEIERLIKKLELDKEILADQENDEAAN